jgi:hypothetical protein
MPEIQGSYGDIDWASLTPEAAAPASAPESNPPISAPEKNVPSEEKPAPTIADVPQHLQELASSGVLDDLGALEMAWKTETPEAYAIKEAFLIGLHKSLHEKKVADRKAAQETRQAQEAQKMNDVRGKLAALDNPLATSASEAIPTTPAPKAEAAPASTMTPPAAEMAPASQPAPRTEAAPPPPPAPEAIPQQQEAIPEAQLDAMLNLSRLIRSFATEVNDQRVDVVKDATFLQKMAELHTALSGVEGTVDMIAQKTTIDGKPNNYVAMDLKSFAEMKAYVYQASLGGAYNYTEVATKLPKLGAALGTLVREYLRVAHQKK